MTRMGTNKRKK